MIYLTLFLLFLSIGLNLLLFLKLYDYEGDIVIGTTDIGKKMFSLDIYKEPESIEEMKVVRFRVVKEYLSDIAE